MIYIYTEKPYNYFSVEFIKSVGRFIFRKKRGPQAVINSLTKGLLDLGESFFLNNKKPNLDGSEIFFVNSSIDSLKWAIKLKKEKKIKKLIAGPNLVVLPSDYNSIIKSNEIDKILIPSDWVKRSWLIEGFNNADKIKIWPVGVDDYGFVSNLEKKDILLYKKNISNDVYLMTKNVLASLNISYNEIVYGNFSRKNYLKKLDKSFCLIYLQESETQGLGLLEAWMKDVPTLVYSHAKWSRGGVTIYGNDVSSPYLNSYCGSFFKSKEDLKNMIFEIKMGYRKYYPRKYYLNNFTNKICAINFLKIINTNNLDK